MSHALIGPRLVPLGGLRAMTVRRTLPSRERRLIGAWCFLDHYGPEQAQMAVPAHPHAGLQTVSWLFSGEIDHTDSAGHCLRVRPGELNLMTAGHGVNHSEFSAGLRSQESPPVLHGCQLWLALPESARHTEPALTHYRPEPVALANGEARVFLGEAFGSLSPVPVFTETLGAEVVLHSGAEVTLPLRRDFEYGILADTASVTVVVEGAEGRSSVVVGPGELLSVDAGAQSLTLTAGAGRARVMLLGGVPLGEDILMWWNFVGRTDAEVRAFRAEWQETLEALGRADDAGAGASPRRARPKATAGVTGRFGRPVTSEPIPAPEMPGVRLKPRG